MLKHHGSEPDPRYWIGSFLRKIRDTVFLLKTSDNSTPIPTFHPTLSGQRVYIDFFAVVKWSHCNRLCTLCWPICSSRVEWGEILHYTGQPEPCRLHPLPIVLLFKLESLHCSVHASSSCQLVEALLWYGVVEVALQFTKGFLHSQSGEADSGVLVPALAHHLQHTHS